MKVELFDRLIQVSIDKESSYSQKAARFAAKHFREHIRLSSSILVLDQETQSLKKHYFLNWLCHSSAQMHTKEHADYQTIMQHSHLPIRIKFTDGKGVTEHITVSMKFIGNERVALLLSRPNRLARRYLVSSFKEQVVGYTKKEVYLDSTHPSFWDKLLHSLTEKTIFNVALKFEYDHWKLRDLAHGLSDAAKADWDASYLTQQERKLRRSYATLMSKIDEPFEAVKGRYLQLAREYHPDNVYGQDHKVVESYTQKFRMIQEAYETIKTSHAYAA